MNEIPGTSLRRLGPTVGVDIDLRDVTALSDEETVVLRELWDEYHLLRFRRQDLTPSAQVGLVGKFGPVVDEHEDGTYTALWTNTPDHGLLELIWHADFVGWTPYPYEAIGLYAIEIRGKVPETGFADTIRALGALPNGQRARLEDLVAINAGKRTGEPCTNLEREWGRIEDGSFDEVISRQGVIGTHPRTGARYLNVSPMFTVGFEGLTFGDGRRILADLFDVLYDPEFVFEHVWESGDFVFWDNIALQHCRQGMEPESDGQPGENVRALRRTATCSHYEELLSYVPGLHSTFVGGSATK
jgi:taurine dioxygenase